MTTVFSILRQTLIITKQATLSIIRLLLSAGMTAFLHQASTLIVLRRATVRGFAKTAGANIGATADISGFHITMHP